MIVPVAESEKFSEDVFSLAFLAMQRLKHF
jgi:hypothetical protein